MNLARMVRVVAAFVCVLVAAWCAVKIIEAGMLLSPRVGFAPTEFDRMLHARAHGFEFLLLLLWMAGAWMLVPVLRRRTERAGDAWDAVGPWFFGLVGCAVGTGIVTWVMVQISSWRGAGL